MKSLLVSDAPTFITIPKLVKKNPEGDSRQTATADCLRVLSPYGRIKSLLVSAVPELDGQTDDSSVP